MVVPLLFNRPNWKSNREKKSWHLQGVSIIKPWFINCMKGLCPFILQGLPLLVVVYHLLLQPQRCSCIAPHWPQGSSGLHLGDQKRITLVHHTKMYRNTNINLSCRMFIPSSIWHDRFYPFFPYPYWIQRDSCWFQTGIYYPDVSPARLGKLLQRHFEAALGTLMPFEMNEIW